MTANLLDFDLEGLAAFCERLGHKRFRAVQLFRWIHQKGVARFEEMTDLARDLRERLAGEFQIFTTYPAESWHHNCQVKRLIQPF